MGRHPFFIFVIVFVGLDLDALTNVLLRPHVVTGTSEPMPMSLHLTEPVCRRCMATRRQ